MAKRKRNQRAPVSIIGVRLDLGAGRRGTDMGPSAVRIAGLHAALERAGFDDIVDRGDVDHRAVETLIPGNPKAKHLPAIAAVCRKLAREVKAAMDNGRIPIVIGGDHSCAVGTVSGIASHMRANGKRAGIIWVDAHADMNTPRSTQSGNVHGMPLSALLGNGAPELTGIMGSRPKVDPERTVLVGIRDLDTAEAKIVRASGVHAFTMNAIDERGMGDVMREAIAIASGPDDGPFHVSFDVDGIDPRFAPGVGTPVPGGLTYREAHLAMELVAESGRMCSVEMVEINPILDVANETARLAKELILSALGKRILSR